jgi:hypothetical protein
MGILFLALAPPVRPEDDFYAPAESKEFSDPFLDALGISAPADQLVPGAPPGAADLARLAEFQRRGHFLAYLSECPISGGVETATATAARLGPTLIRRIRFNYKPKHIAPMGEEMVPLVDQLKVAGFAPALLLDQGLPLPSARTGDQDWQKLFQRSVSTVALRDNLLSGYDRIDVKQQDRKLGAGGNT